MQHPVRYYIVNSDDDQPVVRSVPVSVRPPAEPSRGEMTTPTPAETPAAVEERRGPARVGRIVRSAIRRTPAGR